MPPLGFPMTTAALALPRDNHRCDPPPRRQRQPAIDASPLLSATMHPPLAFMLYAASAPAPNAAPSRSCARSRTSRGGPRPPGNAVPRRVVLSAAALTLLAPLLPADAKVDIDIERFGDKELKVSTINKVKQNVRNVLLKEPALLPYFFELTLHDALTFDPETLEGGPNGSLRLELDRPENAPLADAAAAISAIRALQRQDMSFADTCAFAGAVAVEVTGGPRIIVQLGREDAAKPDDSATTPLYVPDATAVQLKRVFSAAGLDGPRDVVLFHGAIGSLADIAQSRVKQLAEEAALASEDESDDDEEVSELDDVTYGRVSTKKRGAVLVSSNVSMLTLGGKKFSNAYLKALLKAKDVSQLSTRDRELLRDDETRAQMQRYADNNARFVSDVADLYERVTLIGSSFESMKLEDK